jgi:hypothetical protein
MTLGEMMARKRRRSSIEKKITNIVKNNQRQHLTLSTADKQEIYKNLVTSAGYLGSSEHCLMLAMLQHTGLDDVASKSQNHFRSNYLKFLIAIKNDPELKLNYMETVGGQVAFLTGNKEDATLQKDMQKLDDFFLEHLADKDLDNIDANVEREISEIVGNVGGLTRKISKAADASGDAAMGIGAGAGVFLVDCAAVLCDKRRGKSISESLNQDGRRKRMIKSATVISLGLMKMGVSGASAAMQGVPTAAKYLIDGCTSMHNIQSINSENKTLSQVVDILQQTVKEESDNLKDNEMLVHLGETKDLTGNHYSKSYIYNEIMKVNKTYDQIQQNTVFLSIAAKNLVEQQVHNRMSDEDLEDMQQYIEEKIAINVATMDNIDRRQDEVNKIKKGSKKTAQAMAGTAVVSLMGPASAAIMGAYCAVKGIKSIAKTAKSVADYKSNKDGKILKKKVNIFTMESQQAKVRALNMVAKRNKLKLGKLRKSGLAKNVMRGKDPRIYKEIKSIMTKTKGFMDEKERREINFIREKNDLKALPEESLSIDEAYDQVKAKVMKTHEFSEAKAVFEKVDKLQKFEDLYNKHNPPQQAQGQAQVKKKRKSASFLERARQKHGSKQQEEQEATPSQPRRNTF